VNEFIFALDKEKTQDGQCARSRLSTSSYAQAREQVYFRFKQGENAGRAMRPFEAFDI
jgi:hypothetical protein